MRVFQISVFLVFLSCSLNAQDSIFKKNKEVVSGKVLEVGTETVTYRRTDNMTGPVYSLSLSAIQLIRYQGGAVDTFDVTEKKSVEKYVPAPMVSAPPRPTLIYDETGRFYVNNRRVSMDKLCKTLGERKDPKINFMLSEGRRDKIISAVAGPLSVPCYIVGGASLMLATIYNGFNTNYNQPGAPANNTETNLIAAGVIGLLGGAALTVTYAVEKHLFRKNFDDAIERYNQGAN